MESWFHLAARQSEQSWRALRRRRANPPRMASSGLRQKTFRAALEQAEQQLRAAAVIGYDSRPLNLFYGLSQGGRALAAASPLLLGQDWRLQGHGLRHVDSGEGVDVTAVTIKSDEKKDASFRRVSLALGSPQIGQVSLGELWPLMYETTIGQPLGDVRYGPLVVEKKETQKRDDFAEHVVLDTARMIAPSAMVATPLHERPELAAFLARYPATRGSVMGWVWPTPLGGLPSRWGEDALLMLEWQDHRDVREVPEHILDRRLARYRGKDLALPAIAGSQETLHPLMVWWQVLYALSMLARYEPARWTKMIDVDSCDQAVAIEYVLDTAIDAVPDLLDEAFDLLDPPGGAASA